MFAIILKNSGFLCGKAIDVAGLWGVAGSPLILDEPTDKVAHRAPLCRKLPFELAIATFVQAEIMAGGMQGKVAVIISE